MLDKGPVSSYFPLADSLEHLAREIEGWKGKKIWQLPFFRLPRTLSEKTWLEYAKVYRQWPSGLKVEIKPKRVRALYLLSKGKGKFLFAGGSLSETLEGKAFSEYRKRLRLFKGESLGLPEAQPLRRRALRLVEVLETLTLTLSDFSDSSGSTQLQDRLQNQLQDGLQGLS